MGYFYNYRVYIFLVLIMDFKILCNYMYKYMKIIGKILNLKVL